MTKEKLKVAIVMGSTSDSAIAEKAVAVLKDFGIPSETHTLSAHRTPNKARLFARAAEKNGFGVIIAIAGLAAHLPGVLASFTPLPVIGVPVAGGALSGKDALYSIVQMPAGIPVACVGIDNAKNAALFAVQILSIVNPELREKMIDYRKQFGDEIE
ncbi:MAG: 5-(carboxyamino)imidazole ribonucleotide mutase [Chitinivibrionales bacterium]|nr:5-(carboxyamino)imidazole ribonucleotide mutase [Chitinivibrionales bacterium]